MKSSEKAPPSEETTTPEEKHAEFERENGEWNHRLDEALDELEKLAGESGADEGKSPSK
jgi:hypothetical protein